jgi:alpha-1,3-rhamnosyltransferase
MDQFLNDNLIETTEDDSHDPKSIMADGRSALSQYRMLLVSDRIHYTPSVFIHRDTMVSVGGFDERFRLLEDYPLWLNLTSNGHRLYFMNKVTVNYRMHSGAINNSPIPYLIPPNYFKTETFRKIYTYPNLPADIRLDQRFKWIASGFFRSRIMNRKTALNRLSYSTLTVYLNPFRYIIWIRKKLIHNLKETEFYM